MIDKKVVVTTEKRGVFFGTLKSEDDKSYYESGGTTWIHSVTLTDARCCVYWSEKTKGFLGLAANGPQSGSRVTPSAPSLTLYGITSISECSDKAIEAWESEPWS